MVTQVILPIAGAGTWVVPVDCTSIDSLELLGAGGDGIPGNGGEIATGSSAGGGLYAKYVNVSVTPGASLAYQVGLHGGTADSPSSPGTADTWFISALTKFAMGGTTGANALGGFRTAGSPTITSFGGSTATTGNLIGCPGAGGAGGPHGAGGSVGNVEFFPFNSGGTGGGGADGGESSPAGSGAPGIRGGNSRSSDPGGTGAASSASPGGNGINGSGGGGGYGAGAGNHSAAGHGSWEPLWTDTLTGTQYGPSSGAGGPGYSANEPVNGANASAASPNGGGRGGGGGGTAGIAMPGIGDNGLIVITYTAVPPSIPARRSRVSLMYGKKAA